MIGVAIATSAWAQEAVEPPEPPPGPLQNLELAMAGVEGEGKDLLLDFETSRGKIHCRLFHRRAPRTVTHFVGLATGNAESLRLGTGQREKRAFYDGSTFHRVIPGFLIQAGCPHGTGHGHPGYRIKDEFHPDLRHERAGTMSLSNAGKDQGGSQFFITGRATPWLDDHYSVFGECQNLPVIRDIAQTPVLPQNRPRTPVVIEKVVVRWGAW